MPEESKQVFERCAKAFAARDYHGCVEAAISFLDRDVAPELLQLLLISLQLSASLKNLADLYTQSGKYLEALVLVRQALLPGLRHIVTRKGPMQTR